MNEYIYTLYEISYVNQNRTIAVIGIVTDKGIAQSWVHNKPNRAFEEFTLNKF